MVAVIYGELIKRMNLILLNDSVHTRFDTYHQPSSLLGLYLGHPYIWMLHVKFRQID